MVGTSGDRRFSDPVRFFFKAKSLSQYILVNDVFISPSSPVDSHAKLNTTVTVSAETVGSSCSSVRASLSL